MIQRDGERVLCVAVMIVSLHPRPSNHNLSCLLLMSDIHSQSDALFYGFQSYRQVFKFWKSAEENEEIDSSVLMFWCYNWWDRVKAEGRQAEYSSALSRRGNLRVFSWLMQRRKSLVLLLPLSNTSHIEVHHYQIHKEISTF